jgi:uncharacterized delta-60 repeat protein
MRSSFRQVIFFAAALAFSISLAGLPASAAPGDLDTSFGIQGQLYDTTMYRVRATVVQPDGKIVVVGSTWYTTGPYSFDAPSVTRYNTDGSLDYSFGTQGSVLASTTSGYGGYFDGVALQNDGKIVAVGYRGPDSFVVRLTPNGSFDTTFSGDGKVAFGYPVANYDSSRMTSVAIVSGDNILVAGTVEYDYVYDPYHNSTDIFLARLNSNGSFDSTFGFAGRQKLHHAYDLNDIAVSMAIHPTSGKIALALKDDSHMKVALLNENGTFDTNFGNSGVAVADFGYHSEANSVAFQRFIVSVGGYPAITTRLVVGGWAYASSTTKWDFALARFTMYGELDTSFSGDGLVRKALSYQSDMIRAIRIDSAGRIITAGPRMWNSVTDFALVRFTRDGDYDTTFGNQGKVYTQFFSEGIHIDAEASAVALTPEGKIVVAGGYRSGDGTLLARYEP